MSREREPVRMKERLTIARVRRRPSTTAAGAQGRSPRYYQKEGGQQGETRFPRRHVSAATLGADYRRERLPVGSASILTPRSGGSACLHA